ncbi:hypothetical protein AURDEDRAFT_115571 [Auricularia subglabra TFB-10046 SS5]|nr:hypothetical protein AURDEDRAFT_115571 [Auricularia subglabra TFB-10046 SS5]
MLFAGALHTQFAPTVKELRIAEADYVGQEDIDRLAVMTLVESLTVWASNLALDYLVESLCRPDNPMWPRLRHLQLSGSVGEDGGAELVRLARHRSAAQTVTGAAGGVAVAALESIRVREWEIANWVLVQLKTILGEGRVILTEWR